MLKDNRSNPLSNSKYSPIFAHSTTKLLGHRGARAEYLENSHCGFFHIQQLFNQQSKKSPRDACLHGIEFDVQLTADNELVVFHDDDLNRLYGLQARIDELTFAALSKLTATREPILRLMDMLPLLQGYRHIELEIKTHERSDLVRITNALQRCLLESPRCKQKNTQESFITRQPVNCLSKNHLPEVSEKAFFELPITLTSFDIELHGHLQRCSLSSYFTRGLLVNSATQKKHTKDTSKIKTAPLSCDLAARLGCTHLGFHYSLIDKHTLRHCHRYGFTVSAWTVNSPETVLELAHLNVDYVITDYPTLMSTL